LSLEEVSYTKLFDCCS